MSIKTTRRLLFAAFLALGATACGGSTLLAPDCEDPAECRHLPDSGSGDGEFHLPDSGS